MEREIFQYGNTCILGGIYENDMSSAYIIIDRLEKYKPQVIVLGEMSQFSFYDLTKNASKIQTSAFNLLNTEEILLAKKIFSEFFYEHFEKSPHIFSEEYDDSTIFILDHKEKRKIGSPQLSSGYWSIADPKTKLLFGSPHPLLILEDLSLKYTLNECKEMFYTILNNYYKKNNDFNQEIATNYTELYENINALAKKDLAKELLLKKQVYQAAVIRKCMHSFKNSYALIEETSIPTIEPLLKEVNLPDFQNLFRNEDFNELLQQKNEEFKEKNIDQIIEKLCIMQFLIAPDLIEKKLFNLGIHKVLFQGKFKNVTTEHFLEILKFKTQIYKNKIDKLFQNEVHRISNSEGSSRQNIYSQIELSNKFNEKFNKQYKFEKNYYENLMRAHFFMQMLFGRIAFNILRKEKQGNNQNDIKDKVKKYISGYRTEDVLETVDRLIIEANMELKIFKLPIRFERFRELIESSLKEEKTSTQISKFFDQAIQGKKNADQNKFTYVRVCGKGRVNEMTLEEFKSIRQQTSMEANNITNEEFQKIKNKFNKISERNKIVDDGLYMDEEGNLKSDREMKLKGILMNKDSSFVPVDSSEFTIEELEKAGAKQIYLSNYSVDENNNLRETGTNQRNSSHLKELLEKSREGKKLNNINFNEDTEDSKIEFSINQVVTSIQKEEPRIRKICDCIETGEPMDDDPAYQYVLNTFPSYKKKRDEYIKNKLKVQSRQSS